MYFSDRIKLIGTKAGIPDADGYQVPESSRREVWADQHSVTRSEFYAAQANGRAATVAFEMHPEDYQGELKLQYRGQEYEIIRSFRKENGNLDLTCTDKAVDNGKI